VIVEYCLLSKEFFLLIKRTQKVACNVISLEKQTSMREDISIKQVVYSV